MASSSASDVVLVASDSLFHVLVVEVVVYHYLYSNSMSTYFGNHGPMCRADDGGGGGVAWEQGFYWWWHMPATSSNNIFASTSVLTICSWITMDIHAHLGYCCMLEGTFEFWNTGRIFNRWWEMLVLNEVNRTPMWKNHDLSDNCRGHRSWWVLYKIQQIKW